MAQTKTIKFFISSTFKDFLKERNVLQSFVFPKLKKLCYEYKDAKFHFQPVDLRWGVSKETSEDNQTLQYCLNEVERCSNEPKPNLLILLGQRYGWGPLPVKINASDYEKDIKKQLSKEVLKTLVDKWIEKDNNKKKKIVL